MAAGSLLRKEIPHEQLEAGVVRRYVRAVWWESTALYRTNPWVRVLVWTTLTCWTLAALLGLADVFNIIEIPDRR